MEETRAELFEAEPREVEKVEPRPYTMQEFAETVAFVNGARLVSWEYPYVAGDWPGWWCIKVVYRVGEAETVVKVPIDVENLNMEFDEDGVEITDG